MNKGAALALVALLGFAAYRTADAAIQYGNEYGAGSGESEGDFFSLDFFGHGDNIDPYESAGVDTVPHFGEGDTVDTSQYSGNWRVNEYPKYASAIRDAEISNNIPRDLYARLLFQESAYKADIIAGDRRSPVGATGIAQFMPRTGQEMGLVDYDTDNKTIIRDDRLNPHASIVAGARYLARMYRLFNDWNYALMSYNWGPGNVKKHIQGAGAPVPMETSQYVARITADVPVA